MHLFRRVRHMVAMMMPWPGRRNMISCQEALVVMQEFLDGELASQDHHRVRAHFDVCRRCYPKLRIEESFREAVQGAASGQVAPDELRVRVRTLLAEVAGG